MAFPEFKPTVPVFIRTLEERHGAKTLIALGDQRISYAEASQRSARLARGLLAEGAGKGTRIAILMPNGPDWVVAWLAVARIGAARAPVRIAWGRRAWHGSSWGTEIRIPRCPAAVCACCAAQESRYGWACSRPAVASSTAVS